MIFSDSNEMVQDACCGCHEINHPTSERNCGGVNAEFSMEWEFCSQQIGRDFTVSIGMTVFA